MDPEQKRSLQDIMPPARRRPLRTRVEVGASEQNPKRRGRGVFVLMLAGIAVVVLGAVVYGLSTFFEGAVVTIVPREQTIQASSLSLQGDKDSGSATLSYTVATTEKIGVRTVPATGTAPVEESARGRIVVYNNHSGTPQKLIKNTRFETPDGLVFRTQNSISIPGKTVKDGKTIPGSLETEVVAYEAGEKYNIGLTDFTLPGLKGDAEGRSETIYARSKTPMRGGFIGKKAVVDKAVEEKNRTEMRAALDEGLIAAAKTAVPAGFFVSKSLIFISYETEPTRQVDGGAELRERGTAYAILLPLSSFAKDLAKALVGDYEGEDITVIGTEGLVVSIEGNKKEPWLENALAFVVNGSATLVWVIPTEDVKKELAGKDKGALETILGGFPSIERADVVVTPFWNSKFPTDGALIDIVSKSPEKSQ